MSEHITHIAVYEDCTRLVKASKNKFPGVFSQSLDRSYDSGLLCSGSRGNHLNAVPIIEKYKNRKNTKLAKEDTEQIAGAIGWLTHRASDRQMKPLFKVIEDKQHPVFSENECQMYHDAIVFKNVYMGGKLSTDSEYEILSPATLSHKMEGTPASKHFNIVPAENSFTHFYMSEIARQQEFIGNTDNIDDYLDNLIEKSQDLYEDLRIYIDAFHSPEYHKLIEYIHNFNIYDPEDSLIKIVRKVQRENEYPEITSLENALENSDKQCQYAQALKKGYDYTLMLGKFYDDEVSKDELYDFLGIFPASHRI